MSSRSNIILRNDIVLPTALGELSPAWLTEALSGVSPGIDVTSLIVDALSEGTSTRARLQLTYDERGTASDIPRTMWFKTGFNPIHESAWDLYRREAHFYAELAPLLEVNRPRSYFAAIDGSGRAALLLEDLSSRGARFPGGPPTLTPDETAKALDQLAQLHAALWRSPRLADFEWLAGKLPHAWALEVFTEPSLWRETMSSPRCALLPARLRDRDVVREAFRRMLELDQSNEKCFVHGDAHLGNTFVERDGTVGFLDWQLCMAGHWAHDVAELMTTAMTTDDRRSHERAMMAYYLDRLGAYGALPPDFDDAWLSYRQHIIYTVTWFIVPTEMQTAEVQAANGERWLATAADHDPLGSLGL